MSQKMTENRIHATKYELLFYPYTKAEILIDCLRRRVVQLRIVRSASYDISLREKIESF